MISEIHTLMQFNSTINQSIYMVAGQDYTLGYKIPGWSTTQSGSQLVDSGKLPAIYNFRVEVSRQIPHFT